MKIKLLATLSLGLVATSVISLPEAQARDWRNINQRQYNQQHRIYNGVQQGGISPREAARLQKQQADLYRLEAKLRRGGLSFSERARLQREQNELSRNIYRQTHDGNWR